MGLVERAHAAVVVRHLRSQGVGAGDLLGFTCGGGRIQHVDDLVQGARVLRQRIEHRILHVAHIRQAQVVLLEDDGREGQVSPHAQHRNGRRQQDFPQHGQAAQHLHSTQKPQAGPSKLT